MNVIRCRAKVSDDCLHGRSTRLQFGDELPLDEDGTFVADADGGTIVCDACYMKICPLTPSGRGLHHELQAVIERLSNKGDGMTLDEIYEAAEKDNVFFAEYQGMPVAAGDLRDLEHLASENDKTVQEMLDDLMGSFLGAIVDLCVLGEMKPTREEACMSAWEEFKVGRDKGVFPRIGAVRKSLGLPVDGEKQIGTF